ncbi:MAG: FAD-dependent oxidoreductase [Solirubrobacterales bacterium]|nr:FAD-dependent oxidoreductase [Solirubrobacterales bacterium]
MYEHVFRAGDIGPLTLPHRIVMGSMHLGLEGDDDDGRALAAFYRERARAGAALIVTGGSAVNREGAGGRNYSFVNDGADAGKLARVAEAVHEAGGRILLQLFHAGRYADERSFGVRPVAPSAVFARLSGSEPRALTGDEVLATIADFAAGAARAAQLGFDGVELMGSEGYLLNQFTAPATNLRADEWGGDSAGRLRFPRRVAAAVREALGPGRALVYRISGADLVDGGTAAEDVLTLAAALADGTVDALNVGVGWHEARIPTVQTLVPVGAWRPWARAIRDVVDVPVIASNRINTLALADDMLAAGDADFASLARPFLADAEIVARGRAGRAVNVCIACDQACIDRSIFDRRVSCVVNPRAGRELELAGGADRDAADGDAADGDGADGDAADRDAADGDAARGDRTSVEVAVVGGGPAGMEAARALAAAGHAVTLFESADRLGGQFRLAAEIPGKEDYGRTGDYFAAQLPALGVDVRLGSPVTAADELAGFDAVVVATGVVPAPVRIPGADLPHVLSYAAALDGTVAIEPAATAAIVGAGGIGVDVAHRLSHRGSADPRADFYVRYGLDGRDARPPPAAREVTLMRRGERVGERLGPTTRWALLAELRAAGVRTLTGIAYERIEPGAVVIRDRAGRSERVPADVVVIAAGQRPRDGLAAQLRAAGRPHVVIGGAADARELDAERAFREGLRAPALIARLIGSRA